MEYKFSLDDGVVYCNGEPLKYVVQATHDYVNKVVISNGEARDVFDHANYSSKRDSFYTFGDQQAPGSLVREALARLIVGGL